MMPVIAGLLGGMVLSILSTIVADVLYALLSDRLGIGRTRRGRLNDGSPNVSSPAEPRGD